MTPKQLGFRMPAQWEPHAATWMGWPADDVEWRGQLEAVRVEFAALVSTISRFEPVKLLVRDEQTERDARSRLEGANVVFYRFAHNDVWFRDCAPIFVSRGGELAATDWDFNGWGEKFAHSLDDQIPSFVSSKLGVKLFKPGIVMEGGSLDVNGTGLVMTTAQCLLNKNRNPNRTAQEIENLVLENLGLEKMLWLGDGLEGDHTDGHVDTITRFLNPWTIVTHVCEDENDTNFAPMQKNLETIRTWRDDSDEPFEVVPLPLPKNRLEFEGDRLPPTYANFYFCNGALIVPTYGDPNDDRALEILRAYFPDREVIGLSGRALITGGGSFNCVTQQQPVGTMWRGE
jgi:agmatine deiminase